VPSLKVLEEKKTIVDEIKNKINNSKTLVLFDYRGITDTTNKDLRVKLKDTDSEYKVYKNTLLSLAFKDLGLDLEEYLTGPTAIAFSNDDVAAIKVLNDMSKDNSALVLKVGIVEGNVQDSAKLKELANIPDRTGLYTMLAGGMLQITKDLAVALNLYSEQKESGE
jgi:Ribosomal protein L10